MGPDVQSFRADEPITRGELWDALTALGKTRPYPTDPDRLVTMRELDAQLVAALGALPASRAIRLAATDAGLAPSAMLGTETVARLLGLRINHPQSDEALERLPSEPAPRAEAAFSLARMLTLSPARVAEVVELGHSFSLPALDAWQTMVLGRALKLVGFPYVWAGTSEKPQKLWSASAPGGQVLAPGGFDCSGFVWRVYKTQPFVEAPLLATVLKGRTTYEMSGEVKPGLRVSFASLRAGDVVFFGSRGSKSRPTEVGHAGIYVGNGWMVHSSGNGVTLQPLTGWYERTFAWGRRPLAEAGLLVA
jgi:cell wall-associated NlpC family hydrolase